MVDVLSTMMLRLLDLPADARLAKGQDEPNKPSAADDADEDALIEMPIEDVIAIPVTQPTPVETRRRRRTAATVSKPIPVIPAQQRPAPEGKTDTPEPTRQRRRRPRF